MARFQITGPDGATYEITAPDGASETDVLEFARKNMASLAKPTAEGKPTDAPKAEQPSALTSFIRGVGQGASFNWGDEAIGYGKNLPKLVQGQEAYRKAAAADTAAIRADNKAAANANPITHLGGELVGAAIPTVAAMLLPGGNVAAGANYATKAATFGKRVMDSAKLGSLFGGIYGAGAAESSAKATPVDAALNTAMEAGTGAGLGAAVGAAIPPVTAALGAAYRGFISNPLQAYRNPSEFAARKVVEAADRDLGPNGASLMISQAQKLAQSAPETILADAGGDATKKLMRSAVNQPNSQTNEFQQFLDNRARNQFQVIEDRMIKPALGNPASFDDTLTNILAKRAEQATPAFEEAFVAPFAPSQQLVDLMRSRKLLADPNSPVYKAINADIANSPAMSRMLQGDQMSDLAKAHLIKMQLGKMVDWAANPMSKLDRSSADNVSDAVLKTLYRDFVDALRASQGEGVKKYFSAVQQYGDETAVARAMKLGLETGRSESPRAVRSTLERMSEPERQAYRHGLATGTAERNLQGRYTADRIARDWDTPAMDAKMQAVVDPNALGPLMSTKAALEAQSATRKAAQGNSSTAAQLLAAQDSGKEAERVMTATQAIRHAVQGNWMALASMLERGVSRIQGMTPDVAAQILRIMQSQADSAGAVNLLDLKPALMAAMTRRDAAIARQGVRDPATTRGLLAAYYGNASD